MRTLALKLASYFMRQGWNRADAMAASWDVSRLATSKKEFRVTFIKESDGTRTERLCRFLFSSSKNILFEDVEKGAVRSMIPKNIISIRYA